MAKNLLKQVMIKKVSNDKIKNDDTSFVDGIIDKIHTGYMTKTKPKFSKKSNFSASGITYNHGECARYWYLAFDGAVHHDNADAYGVANRTNGTLGHERIQEAIKNSGLLDETMEFDQLERKYNKQTHPAMEFRVKLDDPPFDGYGDAMFNINDERVVGEIKTITNEGFEYKKNSKKPKMGHLMQLLIYMRVWKIDKGVMIYENKNNHELLLFPIEVNDNYRGYIDNTFKWMNDVHSAWKSKQLPIKNYRSNSKVCKICPVRKACDEAGDGIIKIASLEDLSETM